MNDVTPAPDAVGGHAAESEKPAAGSTPAVAVAAGPRGGGGEFGIERRRRGRRHGHGAASLIAETLRTLEAQGPSPEEPSPSASHPSEVPDPVAAAPDEHLAPPAPGFPGVPSRPAADPSPDPGGAPATPWFRTDVLPSRRVEMLAAASRDLSPLPHLGPPGRRRPVILVLALSILTLGLYPLLWHARVNREMREFDPALQVRPGRSAWALAVPVLAGLLVAAAEGARLVADRLGQPPDLPISSAVSLPLLAAPAVVQYLILLLPFSVVAVAMTAERVRVLENHAGIAPDRQLRPAASVAWLLVPIVGGLVVIGREQGRLNAVWERTAPRHEGATAR